MAIDGRSVTLEVNVGTELLEDYQVIASQRDLTINRTADSIEVSDKDSVERRFLGGSIDQSLETSAWYVPSDVAYATLETAFVTQQPITIRIVDRGFVTKTARVVITNLTERHPIGSGSEVTIGLRVDGPFTA